mmetsp:Transcript_50208/g.58605  ORF Transcript_50208/g.58605 Transcript_50208/m.58605 type:complete len:90 (+) Transcript_50208:132-401(+)
MRRGVCHVKCRMTSEWNCKRSVSVLVFHKNNFLSWFEREDGVGINEERSIGEAGSVRVGSGDGDGKGGQNVDSLRVGDLSANGLIHTSR